MQLVQSVAFAVPVGPKITKLGCLLGLCVESSDCMFEIELVCHCITFPAQELPINFLQQSLDH